MQFGRTGRRAKKCPVSNCGRYIDTKHEMCLYHWLRLSQSTKSDLIRSRNAWNAGTLSLDVYLDNLNVACIEALS